MRYTRLVLTLSLLCVAFTGRSAAQWVQTNGPYSAHIYSLGVSGGNIFAGTKNHGTFHSTNNGESWTRINGGFPNSDVHVFAVKDTNLFAGTWGSGIHLSTNDGASWTAVNKGLPYNKVFSFAISGSNLFAGMYAGNDKFGCGPGGVFLSSDNGGSWTSVSSGLPGYVMITALAASGTTLFAGTNGVGIFRSIDSGKSWIDLNAAWANIPILSFAVSPDSSGNIFAGTYSGGIFLSSDNGESWTSINTGLTNTDVYALAFSPDKSGNLFAGTRGGVFLSTNNGTSWTAVNTGLTNTIVYALAVNGANIFAGTWGDGVFLSTNNGESWTSTANTGMVINVLSLAVQDTNLFAGTYGYGVFLSADNGTKWTKVNTGLPETNIWSLAVSGENLFAGTGSPADDWSYGFVYRSTNSGASWTSASRGIISFGPIYAFAVSPTLEGYLFAGSTWSGVYRSTDNGASWSEINTGLKSKYVRSLACSPDSSGTLLVGLDRNPGTGGVYLSTNNGDNWIMTCLGTEVRCFAFVGTNIFAGTWGWGGGVFRSTDGGMCWSPVNNGLTNSKVNTLLGSGANLFAGTDGGGVYLTTDRGESWTEVNAGLRDTFVNSLIITPDTLGYLYAGTLSGVWKRPMSEMIRPPQKPPNELPTNFSLNQNYPNPFTPVTTIQYSLPIESYVSLKVFDALGREVAALVSEELPAGTYAKQWDAADMPSGAYFYRMQSGSFSETRKLVLLK